MKERILLTVRLLTEDERPYVCIGPMPDEAFAEAFARVLGPLVQQAGAEVRRSITESEFSD
jgi:hypothetical protein